MAVTEAEIGGETSREAFKRIVELGRGGTYRRRQTSKTGGGDRHLQRVEIGEMSIRRGLGHRTGARQRAPGRQLAVLIERAERGVEQGLAEIAVVVAADHGRMLPLCVDTVNSDA